MPGLDPNALHVLNGDTAAGIFQQAISGSTRTLVSRDQLTVGPVLPFAELETWKNARVEFWRPVVAHVPRVDLRPAQNGFWENQDRLVSARRIYVWIATGNSDQLMLTFLLELLERIGADPGRIELIQFERVPRSDRRLMQLEQLDASQMRLHPAPRELSMDEWMDYRNAWRALTSATPDMARDFAGDPAKTSPCLRQALDHLARRYPERASGLDFWDLQLLRNVRERGPRAARIVAYSMGEQFDSGDLVYEQYCFWRLLHMASPELPRPLLTAPGGVSTLQDSHFELTQFGAQVCDGEASAWPANPIDYWAGGVHISSAADNLWFRTDGGFVRA